MKRLRALFGLLLVGGGFYVAWMLIPPYFDNYQFQDIIENEARQNTYSGYPKSEEDIRTSVFKKAQDLEIPIKPEQIQVSRKGPEVVISADYTVHVDLPLYPVDLEFHPSSRKNK